MKTALRLILSFPFLLACIVLYAVSKSTAVLAEAIEDAVKEAWELMESEPKEKS